jgi:hypothetical protein
MKFLVICVSEAAERRQHVFEMERENLTMETLGLSLWESKALLRGVQEFMVAEQVADDLERRRPCPDCGKRHTSKARGRLPWLVPAVSRSGRLTPDFLTLSNSVNPLHQCVEKRHFSRLQTLCWLSRVIDRWREFHQSPRW